MRQQPHLSGRSTSAPRLRAARAASLVWVRPSSRRSRRRSWPFHRRSAGWPWSVVSSPRRPARVVCRRRAFGLAGRPRRPLLHGVWGGRKAWTRARSVVRSQRSLLSAALGPVPCRRFFYAAASAGGSSSRSSAVSGSCSSASASLGHCTGQRRSVSVGSSGLSCLRSRGRRSAKASLSGQPQPDNAPDLSVRSGYEKAPLRGGLSGAATHYPVL